MRRVMSELGYVKAQHGELQGAIELLESANRVMDTPHAATCSMLGHLYGAAGDVERGELSYKQSLEAQGVGSEFDKLAVEVSRTMDLVRWRRIKSTTIVLLNYGADLSGLAVNLPGRWPVVDTSRAKALLLTGLGLARALQDADTLEFAFGLLGQYAEETSDVPGAIHNFKEGCASLESRWRSLRDDAFRISLRDVFFSVNLTRGAESRGGFHVVMVQRPLNLCSSPCRLMRSETASTCFSVSDFALAPV